ncbi:MAG: histidine phosphatase family protein [Fibrobacter sp.]|nr:histidine phosphatase family protein [Fibrobacter sp.]
MRLSISFTKSVFPFCSVLALALTAALAGCGDDSSSSPSAPAQTPTSSSGALLPDAGTTPANSSGSLPDAGTNPTSSPDAADPTSSGIAAPENGSFTFATTPGALALAPDEDGFYDMGDVYKAVPQTSKIAFVIRHSKREKSNLGTESQLTPIGIQMAQTLGTKLVGEEPFYYASTNFVRTRETCKNIAVGRGETDVEVVTWDGIDGGYFLTVPTDTLDALVSNKGGNQKYIAQYAYGAPFTNASIASILPGYFYDLFERGNQFVNEVIVANMPTWKRVSVLVSHDMLLEPLIAFVSNRTIDLKFYQTPFRWVNYLSGIAVIVDEAGAVTALPVRGDSVGWMRPADEVDESL